VKRLKHHLILQADLGMKVRLEPKRWRNMRAQATCGTARGVGTVLPEGVLGSSIGPGTKKPGAGTGYQ